MTEVASLLFRQVAKFACGVNVLFIWPQRGYVELVRLNLTYIVSIWILNLCLGMWRLNLQKLTYIPQISRVAVNDFLLQHSKDLIGECQDDHGKWKQRERWD